MEAILQYVIGILVVVLLIIIALRFPRRKDSAPLPIPPPIDVEKLLGTIYRQYDATGKQTRPTHEDEAKSSLLMFFDQSIASRETLKALVNSDDRMKLKELTDTVNRWFAKKEMNLVPENVVQKIVMILMGADLVTMKDARFYATELGKTVCDLLKGK